MLAREWMRDFMNKKTLPPFACRLFCQMAAPTQDALASTAAASGA
ncbi:hypothetical protein HMPREF1986_01196 [Oribacterium sp. oral taxon 078 str. F0263]|nr:hypothetical protein HMPREF1986_01196 [Oribacterium sp. oral taxon 078 str. F0263]